MFVGYQPTGMKPNDRDFLGSEMSKTATLLLVELTATNPR